MPFFKELHFDGIDISFWHIEESRDEMLAFLPHSREYRDRVERFASSKRQIEWLAVRCLFHRRFGEDAAIEYLPSGRPTVRGEEAEISISHSGHLVAMALTLRGRRVGLDIEHAIERAHRLRHAFLSTKEQTLLHTESDAAKLWCAKEAVYKLCDTVGVSLLHDIRLYAHSGHLRAEVSGMERNAEVFISEIDGCALAVAQEEAEKIYLR